MWQELVDQKEKWIGGTLKDFCSPSDRRILKPELIGEETLIVDFVLTETDFTVKGQDFDCGGSRECLGVTHVTEFGPVPPGTLIILGYGGHEFHITRK